MTLPLQNCKVIIVGQDPYASDPDLANGLAFGVELGKPYPPSLQVIQTELAVSQDDIGFTIKDPTLEAWHNQGVMLLNASLTCEIYRPEGPEYLFVNNSHSYLWRVCLMEDLFKEFNEILNGVVFVFMGKKAQYYSQFITNPNNCVFNTIHPVADFRNGNRAFIGTNIFNKINEKLNEFEKKTIIW